MPVSRDGNLYFTNDQYAFARYETSALEYAREEGYQLVPDGRSAKFFHLKEHDSMIFTADGRWFWNSFNLKGGALEFITNYERKPFIEAVLQLNGTLEQDLQQQASQNGSSLGMKRRDILFRSDEDATRFFSQQESRKASYQKHNIESEPKPFELPEKSDNFKRLFAYLCGFRKLDKEIVTDLVKQGRIYESCVPFPDKDTGDIRFNHNAVFVGFDEQGLPKHAYQRGLNSNSTFKNDVPGSNFEYYFMIPGYEGVTKVYAFEAAIDSISHATLQKMDGQDYRTADRINLDGTTSNAIMSYMKTHPHAKEIVLATDNDAGGMNAAENITAELLEAGYTPERGFSISTDIPTFANDWNQVLTMRSSERPFDWIRQPPFRSCEHDSIESQEAELESD